MPVVRMMAPYTGLVHEVDESRVELRLSQGFLLCDGGAPSLSSTAAEIRAYADERGIEVSARATKAQMLAAIEAAS